MKAHFYCYIYTAAMQLSPCCYLFYGCIACGLSSRAGTMQVGSVPWSVWGWVVSLDHSISPSGCYSSVEKDGLWRRRRGWRRSLTFVVGRLLPEPKGADLPSCKTEWEHNIHLLPFTDLLYWLDARRLSLRGMIRQSVVIVECFTCALPLSTGLLYCK